MKINNPIIDLTTKLAQELNIKTYLIGGYVRDYFLNIPSNDLDFAVEYKSLILAEKIAKTLNITAQINKSYQTATLIYQNYRIDFATTRTEIYPQPAAYPKIQLASINDDLKRRDFTINCIAISLNEADYLQVLDPFNGKKDIEHKEINVLHNKSFLDDPTRIFRAIRLAARLNFNISDNCQKLIQESIDKGLIKKLSKKRIDKELELINQEQNSEQAHILLKKFNA